MRSGITGRKETYRQGRKKNEPERCLSPVRVMQMLAWDQ